MPHLGMGEILAILVLIFLLFGATRLPQLARSIGQSRKAFKDGLRETEANEPTRRPGRIVSGGNPELSAISDEDIMAEIRRRARSGPNIRG